MNWKLFCAVVVLVFSEVGMISGQTITNFFPVYGAPGELINIYGSGFAGSSAVRFTLNKDVSVMPPSDTFFQVIIPSGATTGPLRMIKGGVVYPGSIQDFIVIGQEPYITDFAPNSGYPSSSVNILINGSHFTGVTNVSFNGTRVPGFRVSSATLIQVTNLPAGITTGPISLTRSNRTGTSSSNFFVVPSITSFSPSSGRVGNTVVITGTNFTGATVVKFNNLSAPSFVINSNTQITVIVPTNATTGPLSVTTFVQAISTNNFVVPPTIYSFSPSFGKPGTNVTILGANLLGSTTVSFNGANAVVAGGGASNQITATVPAAATSGPITVTTTNGSFTTSSNFFLPPTINSFNPLFGNVGTLVTIQGANFTNATAVTFSGITAGFTVVNNTQLTATVPAGATTGAISVTAPGGSVTTVPNFYLPPVISGLNPANGFPLTQITISGTNFLQATAVKFNEVSASYSISNNNQIVATVPSSATTGAISVTAPGGTGTSAVFVVDVVNLAIKLLTNNAVIISWTTNAAGFFLQGNTNLSSTNWVVVTNVPGISNGTNSVTNSITNSARFFRLKK